MLSQYCYNTMMDHFKNHPTVKKIADQLFMEPLIVVSTSIVQRQLVIAVQDGENKNMFHYAATIDVLSNIIYVGWLNNNQFYSMQIVDNKVTPSQGKPKSKTLDGLIVELIAALYAMRRKNLDNLNKILSFGE